MVLRPVRETILSCLVAKRTKSLGTNAVVSVDGISMPSAASASQYVFQGIWTNWERGSILGQTLTVDLYKAQFISPALAILVSIAGAQLWSIFQFALHQARATPGARNLFYHQQQTILRNPGTDLSTLWRLSRLALAWRRQADVRVLRSSIPLIIWTFVHFAVVLTAGALSTWALEASNVVLSRSPYCGYLDTDYANSLLSTNISDTETVRKEFQYNNHMNSIYSGVQQRVDLCQNDPQECDSVFVGKSNWTSQTLASGCPFQSRVCHPNVAGSISLDTGHLSSATIFGFNTKKSDRVSLRMVAQCAPLDDGKYSTQWQTGSNSTSNAKVAAVQYGQGGTELSNATYTITQQELQCDQRASIAPYAISAAYSTPGGNISNSGATFNPIPELEVSDADVSLMMLSCISAYTGPINDPWFSAQQAFDDPNAYCMNQAGTLYVRDYPITTMGCTQQWQICNTDTPMYDDGDSNQCTPLSALYQMQELLATPPPTLKLTINQMALANRIVAASATADFFHILSALSQGSSPPLKARFEVAGSVGVPLSNTQWETETKYWMDIIVSYLQQFSLDSSTGQFAADTAYITPLKPSSDAATQAAYEVCQTQLITSNSYRNYNFFALVFTVILCCIVIMLGLTMEDLAGYFRQRRLNNSGYDTKRDMWVANGVLEMLKTIDEVRNGSTWTRTKNGIPVTHSSNKLKIADLTSDGIQVEKGIGTVHHVTKNQSESFEDLSVASKNAAHASEPKSASSDGSNFEVGHSSTPQRRKDINGFTNPYMQGIPSMEDVSMNLGDATPLRMNSRIPNGGMPQGFTQNLYAVYEPPAQNYQERSAMIRVQKSGWGVLPHSFTFFSGGSESKRPSSGYIQ